MNKMHKQAKAMLDAALAVVENEESTPEQLEQAYADVTEAKAMIERADVIEEAASARKALEEVNVPVDLPTSGAGNAPKGTDSNSDNAGGDDVAKAVNILRYGDFDDATERVMTEVYDGDYRDINHRQMKAFNTYLRTGKESRILNRQLWDVEHVKGMLQEGATVSEVKATMVEGTDVLGGFAVPVDVANAVIRRLRGLTAVRAAGATIIQTAGKSIEWLKVTGGNDRYTGNVRGAWGSETQNPSEQNMTLGNLTIPVNVYTYKMPMSVSLLEDATNLSDLFAQEVAEALALDEDEAFLIGDGVNKPYGILPNATNSRSLSEKNSGSAAALAINGLKALRRGVASQYRGRNASMIGNSDTGLKIEQLVDGDTRHYVDQLVAGEFAGQVSAVWRESEAMASVAANAYPLIYGDMSGYGIVERLGLSIQRYNDSNTGINKVEFHVRRRLGGDVLSPWKLAVQKVAA